MNAVLVLQPPGEPLREVVDAFRKAVGGACRVDFSPTDSGGPWDLILVDFDSGDGRKGAVELIGAIRAQGERCAIVAVTGKGSVETAAAAISAGANDLLVRSTHIEERVSTLFQKVEQVLRIVEDNRALREQNRKLGEENRRRFRIVGESAQILETMERARKVAAIPRPVLITGERGTGKELVARAIHAAGAKSGPLIAVNCGAFADTLLETELFGHERGAFTGADRLVRGKFELADRGTLFLDEIGHMSLSFQAKLLRVVEYGTFLRVGGSQELHTSARLITATNANLQDKMDRGEFLRDLYDRLSFEVINVPALRDRRGDIELLAQHYLEEFMREIPALGGKRLGRDALAVLRRHRFPGNVRELRNVIERAAYRDTTQEVNAVDLGLLTASDESCKDGRSFQDRIESLERELIGAALERAGGNQAQAARDLQMSYHQFRYYQRKHAS